MSVCLYDSYNKVVLILMAVFSFILASFSRWFLFSWNFLWGLICSIQLSRCGDANLFFRILEPIYTVKGLLDEETMKSGDSLLGGVS